MAHEEIAVRAIDDGPIQPHSMHCLPESINRAAPIPINGRIEHAKTIVQDIFPLIVIVDSGLPRMTSADVSISRTGPHATQRAPSAFWGSPLPSQCGHHSSMDLASMRHTESGLCSRVARSTWEGRGTRARGAQSDNAAAGDLCARGMNKFSFLNPRKSDSKIEEW